MGVAIMGVARAVQCLRDRIPSYFAQFAGLSTCYYRHCALKNALEYAVSDGKKVKKFSTPP